MTRAVRVLAAVIAFGGLAATLWAGDPNGGWKWSERETAGIRAAHEVVLQLTWVHGRLAGTVTIPGRGAAGIPQAIVAATFADDFLAFTVERDISATKVVTKYRGKLTGDFINGTLETLGRDGRGSTQMWTATRIKAGGPEPSGR